MDAHSPTPPRKREGGHIDAKWWRRVQLEFYSSGDGKREFLLGCGGGCLVIRKKAHSHVRLYNPIRRHRSNCHCCSCSSWKRRFLSFFFFLLTIQQSERAVIWKKTDDGASLLVANGCCEREKERKIQIIKNGKERKTTSRGFLSVPFGSHYGPALFIAIATPTRAWI